MFRSNLLPPFFLLCLSILWSGIFFPVSQCRDFNSLLEAGTPFFTMTRPTISPFVSPGDFNPQDTLAITLDRFLTLPFLIQTDMKVVQGWTYTWGATHFGIDYIFGDIYSPGSWKTFDVLAAADGEACVNCVYGPGNKVWIKHTIGNKVYYSYYGHLATVEPNILTSKGASTVKVTMGQKIGTAGKTGTRYIHLHFAVYNASWIPLDPYDLYSRRSTYYPNLNYQSMGADFLFLADPPPDPSQANIDLSAVLPHSSR